MKLTPKAKMIASSAFILLALGVTIGLFCVDLFTDNKCSTCTKSTPRFERIYKSPAFVYYVAGSIITIICAIFAITCAISARRAMAREARLTGESYIRYSSSF